MEGLKLEFNFVHVSATDIMYIVLLYDTKYALYCYVHYSNMITHNYTQSAK